MLQSASSFVASVLNGVAGPNATVCLAEHGVLLRRERGDGVQLVSGGGSGHEPAHAGFVGAGMLSASVAGEVFASPSVAAVLGAVRAVATPAGVLLIVKRYTGDRLNFGAAAERARAAGVRVAVVIVGDDVALPPNASIAGRRGLAGTLFVHKIAGAAAAAGCSLEEVAAEAESVAARVATLGVAWSTSTLPGAAAPSRKLAPGTMEVGLGIHGEEGVETIPCEGVAELVERLLRRLTTSGYVPFPSGCDVALVVNGLGGTPPCELACVMGAALSRLRVLGLRCARVVCGSLVTSLGAGGFSLSLLRIDSPRDLERLDAHTDAPAWPRCTIPPADEPVSVALPSSVNEGEEEEEEEEEERTHVRTPATPAGALLAARVAASAAAVAASEVQLSAWDAVAGDGDCGATCAAGARAVAEDAATWDFESASAVAAGLARAVRRSSACRLSHTRTRRIRLFALTPARRAFTSGRHVRRVVRHLFQRRRRLSARRAARQPLRAGGFRGGARSGRKGGEPPRRRAAGHAHDG